MKRGYVELEFDLAGALLREVKSLLEKMEPADLTAANLKSVEEAAGVYALYEKGTDRLLYIGKAEGNKGLHARLNQHRRKIDGRQNVSLSGIQYRAIRLFVFAAMDLEASLIKAYGGTSKVPWNHSGFGSKDVGRERDTTKYKAGHFDTEHPIRLDESFVDILPGRYPVSEIMQKMKDDLPYLLRFQRPDPKSRNSFEPDFATNVTVPRRRMTTRELVELCVLGLPTGWKATALPSHIICYKNDTRRFPSGTQIAASP